MMSVELRILVVALAAFAAAGVAAALVVPLVANGLTHGSGALRARRLASLRLFPSAIAAVSGGVVLLAFAIFEPRQEGEYMGAAIPALAAFSLLLVAGSMWRARRLARATRALEQRWLSSATPIPLAGISVPAFAVDADFPIVAVVGWRRPRLLIATSVLASCSPDELIAVLAHEQGHIDRRDNLRRLMLSVAPDILAWLPASERMLSAWREAAEDAADDDAARAGADGRVRLASALVKVARLAPGRRASGLMPASALYNGDGLDRRVRRLLDPRASETERRASPWRARVRRSALVIGGVAASALALEGVHAALEVVIHRLP
jgi:Zn-dependent protease with chaperone function